MPPFSLPEIIVSVQSDSTVRNYEYIDEVIEFEMTPLSTLNVTGITGEVGYQRLDGVAASPPPPPTSVRQLSIVSECIKLSSEKIFSVGRYCVCAFLQNSTIVTYDNIRFTVIEPSSPPPPSTVESDTTWILSVIIPIVCLLTIAACCTCCVCCCIYLAERRGRYKFIFVNNTLRVVRLENEAEKSVVKDKASENKQKMETQTTSQDASRYDHIRKGKFSHIRVQNPSNTLIPQKKVTFENTTKQNKIMPSDVVVKQKQKQNDFSHIPQSRSATGYEHITLKSKSFTEQIKATHQKENEKPKEETAHEESGTFATWWKSLWDKTETQNTPEPIADRKPSKSYDHVKTGLYGHLKK